MEIERKYLIDTLPEDYQDYPCRHIEQAYLNTDPVIRIRKDNNKHELTYKSKGLMAREEYNLPLDEASYQHLPIYYPMRYNSYPRFEEISPGNR